MVSSLLFFRAENPDAAAGALQTERSDSNRMLSTLALECARREIVDFKCQAREFIF